MLLVTTKRIVCKTLVIISLVIFALVSHLPFKHRSCWFVSDTQLPTSVSSVGSAVNSFFWGNMDQPLNSSDEKHAISSPHGLWGPLILLLNRYRGPVTGLKRREHGANSSPPSSFYAKKQWNYNSTPSTRLQDVDKENLHFFFYPLNHMEGLSMTTKIFHRD